MKKHILTMLSLLLAVTTVFAERVTQEDAALVANNFMSASAPSPAKAGVRKALPRKMVLKKAAVQQENEYYIYEGANGNGWVMVAANDVARPVIAWSPTGRFGTLNQPKNLKSWLGHYNKQIQLAEANGVEAADEVKAEWKALRMGQKTATAATVVVEPLIQTKWNQDSPYNDQCPGNPSADVAVGCVATAMAQVMNYWQWPLQGTGTASVKYNSKTYTVDFSKATYDWDNMLPYYDYIYDETTDKVVTKPAGTTAQRAAVATLMYHCGVGADMEYGSVSGAWTINYNDETLGCAQNALWKYFGYKKSSIKGYYRNGDSSSGYSSWTTANWIAMLKEELDNSRPIMYAGGDSKGEEGHSFICDGYSSDNKFHFNWGWSGSSDGYYTVDNLIPGPNGIGSGELGDYSYEQDVIVGIVPDKPDVAVTSITLNPASLTLKINEKQTVSKTVLPADALQAVEWSSSNTAVATVENGVVKGIAQGTAVITATAKDESGVKGTCNVTVTDEVMEVSVYEKVTSAPADWSGQYLIVYEEGGLAFNGGLSTLDAASNTIAVTITDGTIEITDATEAAEFTIAASGDSYTIKSASGLYIGQTTDANGMKAQTSELTNSISLNGSDVDIVASGKPYLRYNANIGQERFRYFKSTTYTNQKAIQLYRKADGSQGGGGGEEEEEKTVNVTNLDVAQAYYYTESGDTYWDIDMFNYSDYENGLSYPDLYITVPAASKTALAGDYTSLYLFYKWGANDSIEIEAGNFSITYDSEYGEGLYNYHVVGTWVNGKTTYKLDAVIPIALYDYDNDYAAITPTGDIGESTEPVTITWFVAGAESTSEFEVDEAVVFPANPAGCENGKVFVGWTADASNPSALVDATSVVATTDAVYYAVFATASTGSGSSEPVAKSITFSEQGYDNAAEVASVTMDNCTLTFDKGSNSNAPKYYTSGTAVRLYAGNTMTVSGSAITSIVLTFGSGDGTNEITTDAGTYEDGAWSGSADEVVFTVGGTKGNRRLASITVTTGSGSSTTYSDYSVVCGDVVECELSGISLNTDAAKLSYTVGEEFSTVGLVVTANYTGEGCTGKPVADWSASVPDMTVAGKQTITITYQDKTASYEIEIEEAVITNYSLRDFINNKPTEAVTITTEVQVLAQNGKNLYVTDGTAVVLVYGTIGATYEAGQTLTGLSGTYSLYKEKIELVPAGTPVAGEVKTLPAAEEITAVVEEATEARYVHITDQAVTFEGTRKYVFGSMQLWNDLYSIDGFKEVEYSFTAILTPYNGIIELLPISAPVQKLYNISVIQVEHASIVAAAQAGELDEVTIVATEEAGYEVTEIIVMQGTTQIEVTDGKFVMPRGDVSVTATVAELTVPKYAVNITNDMENGAVVASPTSAKAGDVVTLTITPAEGYELESLTVMFGETEVEVTDGTFTMPAGDVLVSATFKEIVYTLRDFINNKPTEAVTITTEVQVLAQNGKNLYVTDGTAVVLVYGTIGATYEAGQTLSGLSGTYSIYKEKIELVPAGTPVAGEVKTLPAAEEITAAVEEATEARYVHITDQAVTFEGTRKYVFGSMQLWNDLYSIDGFKEVEYSFTAILTPYNGIIELLPISAPVQKLYNISVIQVEHASIVAAAQAGELDEVTIVATEEAGYEVTEIIVMQGTTQIEVTDGKFVMPRGDVSVTATVAELTVPKYAVNITNDMENGAVVASPTSAKAGDVVTLTITPAEGYELESLTVMFGETEIEVTDGTFTMPAGDVLVSATFKEIVYTLRDFINNKPEEAVTITTEVQVLAQNGKNLYVTDGTAVVLVYDQNRLLGTYEQGQTLTGLAGTYQLYTGQHELVVSAAPVAGEVKALPAAEEMTAAVSIDELTEARYVHVTEQALTLSNNRWYVFETVQLWNTFASISDLREAEYSFTGILVPFVNVSGTQSFAEVLPVATPVQKLYNISVTDVEHATIVTAAQAGELDEVTVTVTAESGYQVTEIVVMQGATQVEVADGKFVMPRGDVSVTAVVSELPTAFTITWLDDEGGLIDQTTVEAGQMPTHADAVKPSTAQYDYVFKGWTPEIVAASDNAEYTAVFEAQLRSYDVTFVFGQETKTFSLPYGTPVKAYVEQLIAKFGKTYQDDQYVYTLTGWSPELPDMVTESATYTAVYSQEVRKYNITWVVEDVETTVQVAYGDMPEYDGVPQKAEDEQYTYTFKGWTPQVVAVAGDATYTAVFEATEKEPTSLEIVVVDGEIRCEGDFRIFDITGKDMTNYNGMLPSGMYVVRTADSAKKVMIK